MWVRWIPDQMPPGGGFEHYNYGRPMYDEDDYRKGSSRLRDAKEAIRFAKSIIAEEKRNEDKKKKDEKKPSSPTINWQPIMFWTLPLQIISWTYVMQSLTHTLDAMFK